MFTIWTAIKIWLCLSALLLPFILACCVVAGRADEAAGCK